MINIVVLLYCNYDLMLLNLSSQVEVMMHNSLQMEGLELSTLLKTPHMKVCLHHMHTHPPIPPCLRYVAVPMLTAVITIPISEPELF